MDCPEADNDEEMGTGICYRCGSTEHELHKCKAKVDPALGKYNGDSDWWRLQPLKMDRILKSAVFTSGDYPYAKCFICGQSGHLSRSCPDNPKGLYAQGMKMENISCQEQKKRPFESLTVLLNVDLSVFGFACRRLLSCLWVSGTFSERLSRAPGCKWVSVVCLTA